MLQEIIYLRNDQLNYLNFIDFEFLFFNIQKDEPHRRMNDFFDL